MTTLDTEGRATTKFSNPVIRWLDHRLPVFTLLRHQLHEYPTPRNLNYLWNFGSLAGIVLVTMIATGIVLAMHYVPTAEGAFISVERIMRDVNYGWLIRYVHTSGASMFFAVVYIHIFRGLYYGSYKAPRELLWILGVLILLLMMATAFFGYTLPWGQMSFWGATVITNLFSAIPIVGMIPFHPYYTIKDLFGLAVFFIVFAWFIFYEPSMLLNSDNSIPANPGVTPSEIVPEWYLLPFYAILKSIPNKLLGVAAMAGSILLLFVVPWLDTSMVRSARFRPVFRVFFWILVADCVLLVFAGGKPPEGIWLILSRVGAAYYFLHFLVVLPLVGKLENPLPLPTSIGRRVLTRSSNEVKTHDINTGGG